MLRDNKILKRISQDIGYIFDIEQEQDVNAENVGELWDNEHFVAGGINYSED